MSLRPAEGLAGDLAPGLLSPGVTMHRPTSGPTRGRPAAGFTLVEVLVVLVILASMLLIGLPALHRMLLRSKLKGFARESANLMRLARLEAIKRSRFGVVAIEPARGRLIAFADVDRDGALDLTAGDAILGRLSLPPRVEFRDHVGNVGLDSVDGFANPDLPADRPVFREDGSAVDDGALRVADERGNVLEVRIEPASTGRVEVRKYDADRAGYFAPGENDEPWEWE